MNTTIRYIVFLSVTLCFISAAKLPDSFMKCRRHDPGLEKCLQKSIKHSLGQLRGGIPQLGLLPLDPLLVETIDIGDEGGTVTLRQSYQNINIIGISDSDIIDVKSNWDTLTLHVESFTPVLQYVGNYSISGRVLLLNVAGKGICNITMEKLTVYHDLTFESFMKKGKEYLRVKEFRVTLKPKLMHFHFNSVLNNNPELVAHTNRFINENWEQIFQDLKGSYEETFGIVFKDVTNKIFTKTPFDEIFLLN